MMVNKKTICRIILRVLSAREKIDSLMSKKWWVALVGRDQGQLLRGGDV